MYKATLLLFVNISKQSYQFNGRSNYVAYAMSLSTPEGNAEGNSVVDALIGVGLLLNLQHHPAGRHHHSSRTGVLAGLKESVYRWRRWQRRRPIKVMEVWKKMVFPLRKLCLGVISRLKARKNGAAILKLHHDIQTCGYEDVQVMWEMLRNTESELLTRTPKRKQRPFWRIFVRHNQEAASTFSMNKA